MLRTQTMTTTETMEKALAVIEKVCTIIKTLTLLSTPTDATLHSPEHRCQLLSILNYNDNVIAMELYCIIAIPKG